MKKTFKQVTVDDNLFICYENDWEYKKMMILKIDSEYITVQEVSSYREIRIERTDNSRATYKDSSSRGRGRLIFSTEAEAIRYCKSFLMAQLKDIIKKAKSRIKAVKDFRVEHYDKLNSQWLDTTIQKMESEIK